MRNALAFKNLATAALLLFLSNQVSQGFAAHPKRGSAGSFASSGIELNGSWWYTWGTADTNNSTAVEYAPMLYSANAVNPTNLDKINGYTVTPSYVLGMNEPEVVSQGATTPALAVAAWDDIQSLGLLNVSPATLSTNSGRNWMADFMGGVTATQNDADPSNDLHVDAIAFHWYGANGLDWNNPNVAFNALKSAVNQWHADYPDLPLWMTEFGLRDKAGDGIPLSVSIPHNVEFFKMALPWLDAQDFVQRYSWFQWNFDEQRLWRGGEPTDLGIVWASGTLNGMVRDLDGASIGEDRMYMRGGTLTNTGGAIPNTLRRLKVFAPSEYYGGDSVLSGTGDMEIVNGGWVEVEAGAVLRKEGTNQVTINSVSVSNNGTVAVAGGTMRLIGGAGFSGSGKIQVEEGGRLSLGDATDRVGISLSQPISLNGGSIQGNRIVYGAHTISGVGIVNATTTLEGEGALFFRGELQPPSGGGGGGIVKDGGGYVSFSSVNTYQGDTVVRQGTLALVGSGSIADSPLIDVRPDATLNVAGLSKAFTLAAGQTLNNDSNRTVFGDVVAGSGSTVSGAGAFANNLTALSGSVVRPGSTQRSPAGIAFVNATPANTTLADGTALIAGSVGYTTTGHAAGDQLWSLLGTPSGQDAVANGGEVWEAGRDSDDSPALRTTITGLSPGETVDVYAYFWGSTSTQQGWRGRASLTHPDLDGTADGQVDQGWNTRHFSTSSFNPMTHVTRNFDTDNPGPVTTDDGGNPGFENGGYFASGSGPFPVVSFEDSRFLAEVPLGSFAANAAGAIDVYIDELIAADSKNRTWYDGVGYGTTALVNSIGTMTVEGDFTQQAGATLAIQLFSTSSYDRLEVGGSLNAGGTLAVTLASGSATLQAGDGFDVFDFHSVSGVFDAFSVPELAEGLSWNTFGLLTTGELQVVNSGDFNADGWVDEADYAVWQNHLGQADASGVVDASDYELWLANFNPPPGPADVVFAVASGSPSQDELGRAVIDSVLSVTKTDAGTLVFNAANPYTGPTTVAGGTLLLENAQAVAASPVTVTAGATLAVASGITIQSPAVTVDGGRLSGTSLVVNDSTGITTLTINAGTISDTAQLTAGLGGLVRLPDQGRMTVGLARLTVDETSGGGLIDLGASELAVAAGGISAADLRADLIAGRNGGGWNGAAGITSSAAATSGG
ncbi:MAG: hypothetical protein RLZZ440_41, partial [Planctomycetota bacterium]